MEKEDFVELLDFLADKEIHINEDKQTLIFISFFDIAEFTKLFGCNWFCEGDIECTLLQDYIVIDLQELLENEDLEIIRNRFKEEE